METSTLSVNDSIHAAGCSNFEVMATNSMTTRHGRRQKGLVCSALMSLLVQPVTARAQAEPSVLKEREPPVEVCTGKMADGSGTDFVNAMVFTPDGRNLLLGCKSGAVELRSVEGQLQFRQQPIVHHVGHVAITPDGSLLLSVSGNTVHLWSGAGEARGSFDTTICEGCSTNAAVISPDGSSLLTGHDNAAAVLWTFKGVQLRQFEDPRPFMPYDRRIVQLAFDPDGSGIAGSDDTGTVRRWSATGRLLGEVETGFSSVNGLFITASGDLFAAGSDGAMRWDSKGKQQGTVRAEGIVNAFKLLPDGSAVVLAGMHVDDFLEMRDLQGRVLFTFLDYYHSRVSVTTLPPGAMAVSPDSKTLVVADSNRLHRWELPMGSP
ncbi:hypothetical protein KBY93_15355 [Synechococcus sp. J7-Johnson]|uniref:WD40 repeat domain-containing protein n=1 Tax=Synechococcus sp. J7-Johnson TaxID=2823737 RepID=UPI0020CE6AC2|nr:hypothetical protein [Synechococcus sp. J7-Johnson]MCP9841986.1 hypothetical protein [Synechococcus sp. J7-Johnson]